MGCQVFSTELGLHGSPLLIWDQGSRAAWSLSFCARPCSKPKPGIGVPTIDGFDLQRLAQAGLNASFRQSGFGLTNRADRLISAFCWRWSTAYQSTRSGIRFVHLISNRFDKALVAARSAIQKSPNYTIGHRVVVLALGHPGRLDEARFAGTTPARADARIHCVALPKHLPVQRCWDSEALR